jgi:hypothetical protein
MRIFTAVRHSINPKYYYGKLWSSNFYPALQNLGHEIIESQVDLLPASHFMQVPNNFTSEEIAVRTQITEKILDEVRQANQKKPVDLFLCYFYNAHFDPAGFEEIHKLGIPTVNFYCNSIYQFELVEAVAAKVNFSWHAEKDARSLYLKTGANPVWVQMGADPNIYYPVKGVSRKSTACFVGQRYADRDRWMASLIRAGVSVEIYGPGWGAAKDSEKTNSTESDQVEEYLGRKMIQPGSIESYFKLVGNNLEHHGIGEGLLRTWKQFQYRQQSKRLTPLFTSSARGAIPFQQICSVFSAHEVILSFSNVWADGKPGSKLIPHVRLRDFEAPMCRTCYLTGYTKEIEEFYEIGKEIDTYNSSEELVDKTRFYLARPTEAEKLREAGYQRALNHHTWEMRFKELFYKIGLNSA